MAHSCPRLTECTDVDEKGDSKKLRHCFNCCQRANHAPVDCPYRVQRWRVHTNSKRFFEALESGEEWKPIFPGHHELKSNPSAAHATTPRSTPHTSRPPPCKWILRVTGTHQWGEAEAENCMSWTPHVESAEKRDDALLLHFGSEYSFIYSPICATPSPKIKTFEKLGTLGFWTSTTSWKRPFCLIPSKNHFLIFAAPYRRCFPPPCNPWGPPKTKICRLQTKKSGVIKWLHSIISGSCRLSMAMQILWRLHMRVAHSCCPPFAMLAFFSSTHVR